MPENSCDYNEILNKKTTKNGESWALPEATYLPSDCEMPDSWISFCLDGYPKYCNLETCYQIFEVFKEYHLKNNISSRNWAGTFKVYLYNWIECKKEGKQFSGISRSSCPSCQRIY